MNLLGLPGCNRKKKKNSCDVFVEPFSGQEALGKNFVEGPQIPF